MRKQKGFTLVEMLVVIAIIAILAGAVLLAINPVATMRKSRDTTRLSDLDSLRSAINIALTEGEIELIDMPDSDTSARDDDDVQEVDGSGYVQYRIPGEGTPQAKTGLGRYIPALPRDPTNEGVYVYTFRSTADNYEINAVLEYPDNATKMEMDGGNNNAVYEVGTSLTIID